MNYNTIKIPHELNKPYKLMSIKEVEEYFDWFMTIKDSRLQYLMQTVFHLDEPSFSEKNIQTLHYFMVENIYIKSKTKEEIQTEIEQTPEAYKATHTVNPERLIEPTISIAIDIGIYIAEYLRKEVPDLKWDIEKRNVEQYGRPMLIGENKYCCPSNFMSNFVDKIRSTKAKEDELLSIFKNYLDTFTGKGTDFRALVNSWSKKKK
jgi:hypothetical protein